MLKRSRDLHPVRCLSSPGSWACTPRWFWSLASSCVSSSAAYLTPSCLRSCPTSTASWSCAPTSSWSGRRGSWTWRRKCTPNSSSSTALQRPWSSGPERKLSDTQQEREGTMADEKLIQRNRSLVLLAWAAIQAACWWSTSQDPVCPLRLGSDEVSASHQNTRHLTCKLVFSTIYKWTVEDICWCSIHLKNLVSVRPPVDETNRTLFPLESAKSLQKKQSAISNRKGFVLKAQNLRCPLFLPITFS